MILDEPGGVTIREFTVRADLAAAARTAAAGRGIGVSQVVVWALTDYLRSPGATPSLAAAERSRLAVRLPTGLYVQVEDLARTMWVGPRLVVEAALARALTPARERGPGWQPNQPSDPRPV